ncbi:hypothetical protein SAMN05216207_1005238 [Pseudonocardia ammonioxydans]|uniref:Uncharacterized protein n=1 Tax=Pseudonocardia ammonioxydans TaxID=260086 RepID=A0A1I4V8R1_PSUAM|nr:hypothetical protein [Pseudonocardia ammonioxydans]SFM97551.1 hypothetical protein SAMN05216207_1005238 [Pseudonocardia ammonioxydans]
MSRDPYERYYAERGAEGRRSAGWPWVPLAGVVVLVTGSILLASGVDGGPPPRPEAAPLTPPEAAAPVVPAETPARTLPTVQAVPTRSTPATSVQRPRSTVRTGTYAVGTDIEPGRWATPGRAATRVAPCSWERSRDGSGVAASALAHGRFQGPASIGLNPGEFVEFAGGCTWTRVTGS